MMTFPPLVTPDAIELAVQLGANDLPSLSRIFDVPILDEVLWNALGWMVQVGWLDKYVSHEDPSNVRMVFEATRVFDGSDGAP